MRKELSFIVVISLMFLILSIPVSAGFIDWFKGLFGKDVLMNPPEGQIDDRANFPGVDWEPERVNDFVETIPDVPEEFDNGESGMPPADVVHIEEPEEKESFVGGLVDGIIYVIDATVDFFTPPETLREPSEGETPEEGMLLEGQPAVDMSCKSAEECYEKLGPLDESLGASEWKCDDGKCRVHMSFVIDTTKCKSDIKVVIESEGEFCKKVSGTVLNCGGKIIDICGDVGVWILKDTPVDPGKEKRKKLISDFKEECQKSNGKLQATLECGEFACEYTWACIYVTSGTEKIVKLYGDSKKLVNIIKEKDSKELKIMIGDAYKTSSLIGIVISYVVPVPGAGRKAESVADDVGKISGDILKEVIDYLDKDSCSKHSGICQVDIYPLTCDDIGTGGWKCADYLNCPEKDGISCSCCIIPERE
ncbi:MAG: hypothetical protein ABIG37_00895 [Nanoarchaeota archaeon]